MKKIKKNGIREIALKTGLNISTVSRALNHSIQVSRETTELVQRTANEMKYRLQNQRKSIVVILPDSQKPMSWFSLEMLNALVNELRIRNYHWEFVNIDNAEIIRERSISGILSLDYGESSSKMLAEKFMVPVVCINDAPCHLENVYSVISDDAGAVNLAIDCFYDYGHRRIAYVDSSGDSFQGCNRRDAFKKGVKQRGIESTCICIRNQAINHRRANELVVSHGLVHDLYRKGITAILSDGESQGLTVYNSLNFCKIRIPEEMSLITWELPYISSLIQPSITTVGQNFSMLAENALLLIEHRQDNRVQNQDIYVPYKLHLRNSVALPRE